MQKTAYDGRISDWSSDVCSSDLPGRDPTKHRRAALCRVVGRHQHQRAGTVVDPAGVAGSDGSVLLEGRAQGGHRFDRRAGATIEAMRSEEHTSELQSLMRTSYAVFCLKKKTSSGTSSFHPCWQN